jgi:EmrB/QacA subfamily drug resistance transporter
MGILIFATFMDLLDVTIVQVALPSIRTELGATASQLEWIVSGYMLAFAVLLVTGGRLGDILGRQRTFLIGVGGFTLASAIGAFAANGDMLVASRVVQGAFSAMMVPQALATLQALFSPKERAPIFGIIGGVGGLAAVVGPILGGALVTADIAGSGWRSIFFINVPIGIVVFILAARFVPNTKSARKARLDVPGVLLLTGALLGILYPVVEGRALDWAPWLWLPVAGGVMLVVLFIAYERRREARDGTALLPMRLFANRGFSAGLVTQATFQGAMNALTVVLLIYVQAALGFTALGAGLSLLPFSLGAFIGTGAAIPLGTKIGKPIVTLGALIQAGGIVWVVAWITQAGTSLTGWTIFWPMLVTGVGLGLLIVPLVDIALATIPIADAGAASGVYGTFQQIGAAVGVAVSGTVFFTAVGTDFSQPNVLAALRESSWIAVGGYLLAALASLLLPKRSAVLAHVAEVERLAAEDLEVAR